MSPVSRPSITARQLVGVVLVVGAVIVGGCTSQPNLAVLLNVTVNGDGRVHAPDPAVAMDCANGGPSPQTTCQISFADLGAGGAFDLIAEPAAGWQLSSWAGCSSTSGLTCMLTFTQTPVTFDVFATFVPVPTGGTVVFTDDFEGPASSRWQSTAVGSAAGPTGIVGTDTFQSAGGNPGGYLEMNHMVDGVGTIQFQHVYQNGSYDPSTQGAIGSIDYQEDQLSPAGSDVSTRVLLVQNGQVSIAVMPVFNSSAWVTFTRNGLTASDFSPMPDFSTSGGPIQFGFERANSNTSVGVIQDTDHGMDNWMVTVHITP